MPITIGNNITSLKTQRQLGKTTDQLSRVYERLASGQRINHASDDAAGLSIASQLNSSARVMTQAIRNVNDGVSALSIAEGAAQQLTGILQRQKELATQSANGTYSTKQRTALQTEANQLTSEFNRIIATTTFNGATLLDGSNQQLQLQVGANGAAASRISVDLSGLLTATSGSTSSNGSTTAASGSAEQDTFDFSSLNSDGSALLTFTVGDRSTLSNGQYITFEANDGAHVLDYYIWLNVDGFGSDPFLPGDTYGIEVNLSSAGANTAAEVAAAIANALDSDPRSSYFDGINFGGDATTARFGINTSEFYVGASTRTFGSLVDNSTSYVTVSPGDYLLFSTPTQDYYAWFSAGPAPDPAIAGRTGIQISYDQYSDAATLRNAAAAAIASAVPEASISGAGTSLVITSNSTGAVSGPSSSIVGFQGGWIPVTQNTAGTTSAVSAASDTFTIASHGFTTGQALTLSTTGALPGGLSVGTYYAIIVNSNTIKLATSASNASAGTAVNITNAGTGTTTFSYTTTTTTNTGGTPYISNLDLSTQSASRTALTTIDTQMQMVSTTLGSIGASQSRLGSALNTLAVARENNIAAASRIMDVNIASESAALVRNQILQQATSAVLAQANQQPALALKLLKGG